MIQTIIVHKRKLKLNKRKAWFKKSCVYYPGFFAENIEIKTTPIHFQNAPTRSDTPEFSTKKFYKENKKKIGKPNIHQERYDDCEHKDTTFEPFEDIVTIHLNHFWKKQNRWSQQSTNQEVRKLNFCQNLFQIRFVGIKIWWIKNLNPLFKRTKEVRFTNNHQNGCKKKS
jgi:hypothetical protein